MFNQSNFNNKMNQNNMNMSINQIMYNQNMNMMNNQNMNMNMMNNRNMNMNMNMMNRNQNMNMNMMNNRNMNMNMNMNMMNRNQNMNMMMNNNQNMNMNMMMNNNQNMNMNMNMMNSNQNMNMMNSNQNMNMMNSNQNMNMMNNNQNINNMNMFNNNNMKNIGINNQVNNNNINNNFNNNLNQKLLLMYQLFKQLMSPKVPGIEPDPYEIQRGIGRGLNNNQPYNNYVSGGNQLPKVFITSSEGIESANPGPNKVNLIFVMMQGNKHTKTFKKNEKIRYVLEQFVESFGLSTNTLKKIYFLFNATNLNNLEKHKTLEDFHIVNNSRINVIDLKNIIGA